MKEVNTFYDCLTSKYVANQIVNGRHYQADGLTREKAEAKLKEKISEANNL